MRLHSAAARHSRSSWFGLLDLDAHPLDAELLGELLRAGADVRADVGGQKHRGFAALREHFALEPLDRADRDLLECAAVRKRARAALDLEACDLGRVQNL